MIAIFVSASFVLSSGAPDRWNIFAAEFQSIAVMSSRSLKSRLPSNFSNLFVIRCWRRACSTSSASDAPSLRIWLRRVFSLASSAES